MFQFDPFVYYTSNHFNVITILFSIFHVLKVVLLYLCISHVLYSFETRSTAFRRYMGYNPK